MGFNLSANLSLQTPILSGIERNDAVDIGGAQAVNTAILEKAIAGIQLAATVGVNASVVNTGGNRNVFYQGLSAGCISSITGAIIGVPFNLIFQSVGSIGIADVGVFKLASNFNATLDDVLCLVWDGTNYYEITRSTN